MSEQDGPTPDVSLGDSAGSVPIAGEPVAGEGGAPPSGEAGGQPIVGEGTTYTQKALDSIAGENIQAILGTGAIVGERTQSIREAEVPAERTTDVPLAENPDRD